MRGIREGSLTNLTPLVVLVGPNGAGKSTILDALLIGAVPEPSKGIGQVVERREGVSVSEGARWLLWKAGQEGSPAKIRVETDSGVRSCTVSVPDLSIDKATIHSSLCLDKAGIQGESTTVFERNKPYFASGISLPLGDVPEVRFLDPRAAGLRTPLHPLHTKVIEQGLRSEILESIKALIPGLRDIQILAPEDAPVVYLIFEGYALPAALAGDGLRLLLHLTFELATQPGGLVLMEEPEAHLHPGAFRQCARAILAAMRRKSQVILSTHSLDLIDFLLSESSGEDLDNLNAYQVRLEAGILKSARSSGPDVAFSRSQIEDDLR